MTLELSEQMRRELVSQHPVIRRAFCIATPAIRRAADLVLSAIYTGKAGLVLKAPPRFGKTHMADYVSKKIATEACPLAATILYNAQYAGTSRSSTQFYRELAFQSCLVPGTSKVRSVLSEQVRRAWWARATEHKVNRLIFFCDEGQRMNESEFRWLIDVFNYLQRQRVLVTSIFICQPDIENRRNSLISTGSNDIVFRFLPKIYSFYGATSVDELASILSVYDDPEQLQFPAESGICYSRFFLPQAYAAGWRLKLQARRLWDAFHPYDGKSNPIGIGMEWITDSIQHVLSMSMDEDRPSFDIADDVWSEAARGSGYFDLFDVSGNEVISYA